MVLFTIRRQAGTEENITRTVIARHARNSAYLGVRLPHAKVTYGVR